MHTSKLTKTKSGLGTTAAILSSLLLGACMSPPQQSAKHLSDADRTKLDRMQEVAVAESAKLREMQDQLLRELTKKAEVKPVEPPAPVYDPLEGKTISVAIANGSISQILTAFADAAKVNLIVEPAVVQQGAQTDMFLKDVSLREAFNEVLRSYDVAGEVRNQTLRVRLHEEKFMSLGFLNVSNQMSLNSGGNVFGSNTTTGNSAISGSLSMSASAGNSTDPYTEIENNLRTILGDPTLASNENRNPSTAAAAAAPQAPTMVRQPNQGQGFTLNRSTGTLFVKARPSQMRAVEDLIKRTQNSLTKQVYIEAQLIDVTLSDGYQFGIDWTQLRSRLAVNFGIDAVALGGGEATLPGASRSYPASSLTIPSRVIGSTTGGASGGLAYQNKSGSTVINALRSFGNLRVLSNPNIQVRNGTPAMLSVGTSQRYVSRSSSAQNNIGGGSSTVTSDVQTDAVFSGVMVGVLPMMREDGTIELLINPVQSDVDPQSLELVSVNDSNRVSLPQVAYKGLTTTLNVNDGDVVVVGGLIDQSTGGANSGVPFLADIPVFGKLVTQENDSQRTRELIVVLRVRVL